MRDLHSNVAVRVSFTPATLTTDAAGAAIDRQGFESLEHVVTLGASGDTLSGAVFLDLVLQHSDDGSAWADVTDLADVLGGVVDADGVFATIDDASGDERVYRIGYVGEKRYSRVAVEFTGTHTNGIPVSAVALLGHAGLKPAV